MRFLAAISIVLISMTTAMAQSLPSWRQVIPAAASVPGNQGADWRTDVVIYNPSPDSATVTLQFLGPFPDGLPGEPDWVVLPESLGSGQTLVLTDVVASLFPDRSVGALVVTTRDTSGNRVPVVVTSRTWTQGPAPSGTYGQGIPAVVWDFWEENSSLNGRERILTPLESSEAFRTNIGVVNLSQTFLEIFAIDFLDPAGDVQATHWFELPPQSWIQFNGLPAFLGLSGSDMTAKVRLVNWTNFNPWNAPGTPSWAPDWVTYGSMVDNRTNDPTYIEALPETTRSGLPRQRIVPAAAHTEGAEGSLWVTDLIAHHAGDTVPTFLQVDVVPTDDNPIGSPSTFLIPIWPGQTVSIDDVIGERFPSHEVAALVVKGWNGGSYYTDLKVSSRTWTPSAEGEGTYGQSISGLPRRYGSDSIIVPGLTGSTEFRSNLGITNPSTNLRETFIIEIVDAEGQSKGALTSTLEPMSHTQINGVLQSLGLEGVGFTAIVSLESSENLYNKPSDPWDPIFTAYGSVVDNRTNDPTFVAGTPLPAPDNDSGDWVDFDEDKPWYRCPDTEVPFAATVVRTFDQAYHYFGAEDHRTIVEQTEFPEGGDWNQIGLRIHLECPESGDCDDWDRTGSLQMVLNPEAAEEDWEYLELARYITPYNIEMCEYIDITALGPMLSGTQTLVSWIDTWVGPGHSSGEGWRITYDFVFYPGTPRTPFEVRNVWGLRSVTIGNPDNPIDDQVAPVALEIPADVTRVEARLISTGHYFGVTENCAEFCVLRQDVYVNDQQHSVLPWRTDCEYNPHSPQAGTWLYDRNGWCPGAVVVGEMIDLTDSVTPGETAMIDFDIRRQDGSVYENTVEGSPFEWVSMQVFLYR